MEFIVTVPETLSVDTERSSYEIERTCDDIGFMINDNINFDNPRIQKLFDVLCDRVAKYETLKDRISNEVCIPAAIEKWGIDSSITWSLDFRTRNANVVYIGKDTRERHTDAIQVQDDELITITKNHSVATTAFQRLFSRMASAYPTLDNEAYAELEAAKEKCACEYEDIKRNIENKYVQVWADENLPAGSKYEWQLQFDTGFITISVLG